MDNAARVYVCTNPEHASGFLEQLNQQRLKGAHCDATIKVQGHLFKTHINVLSASLGYFRDIFSKTAISNLPMVIDIPDIVNSTGFSKVLDYIYTSNLSLSQNTVMETLCSACYLQSPFVVKKCQEFIQTHGFVPAADYQKNNVEAWLSSFPKQSQPRHMNQDLIVYDVQGKPSMISNGAGGPPSHNGGGIMGGMKQKPYPSDHPYNTVGRGKPPRVVNGGGGSDPKQRNDMSQNSYYNHPTAGGGMQQPSMEENFEMTPIDHKSLADYFANETKQQNVIEADQSQQRHHSLKLLGDNADEASGLSKHPPTSSNVVLSNSGGSNGGTNTQNDDNNNQQSGEKPEDSSFTFTNKKDKPKKEYTCEYCFKQFGRQQHLKRHILTHTGERPYPCTLCDKRFRRSEHLKHHLVSHDAPAGLINQLSPRKRARRLPEEGDIYTFSKYLLSCSNNNGNNMGDHLPSSTASPNIMNQMGSEHRLFAIEDVSHHRDGSDKTNSNGSAVSPEGEEKTIKIEISSTAGGDLSPTVTKGALNLMKKPKKAANPRKIMHQSHHDLVLDGGSASDDIESVATSSPVDFDQQTNEMKNGSNGSGSGYDQHKEERRRSDNQENSGNYEDANVIPNFSLSRSMNDVDQKRENNSNGGGMGLSMTSQTGGDQQQHDMMIGGGKDDVMYNNNNNQQQSDMEIDQQQQGGVGDKDEDSACSKLAASGTGLMNIDRSEVITPELKRLMLAISEA